MTNTPSLDRDLLIAEARRRTGKEDVGDTWFYEPLDIQVASLRNESNLSELGTTLEAERLVSYLMNRLRRVDLLKRHPEIRGEDVRVAATVISLARTGSTKMLRILGSTPGHTTLKTWEGMFPLPLEGEELGKPIERRRLAQATLDSWPDMSHIHPISLDTPEEEGLILDQSFAGMMAETFVWMPTFSEYMKTMDQTPAYQELKATFQILQWLNPERRGKRWILKCPTHMSAPKTLLDTFPGSMMIQTHRDPLKSMPSHCSMNNTFIQAKCQNIPPAVIGRYTCKRWAQMSDGVIDLRDTIGDERFIDVQYQDLTERPLDTTRAVFDRLGTKMTAADEAAVSKWLAENKREKWAPHIYDLETYGLSEDSITSDFARYRQRYCS
jgi:hypothetical protein